MGAEAVDEVVSLREVTARIGLSVDTLRYYERQGLLPSVARSVGGQRRYTTKDLHRLSFLIHLRATGMSIARMRQFATLRQGGEAGRPARLELLLEHRATVGQRVDALRQNLHAVDLKIDRHRRVLRQQGAPVPDNNADETSPARRVCTAAHPPRAARRPAGRRAAVPLLLGRPARHA